jgi:glycosyltransferase involved in cell wall biosynthesis
VSAASKTLRPYVEEERAKALAAFDREYPGLTFPDTCVVIAALDEEGGVGDVIDGVHRVRGDLGLDVLVIDDGSSDRTREVSIAHGAKVARLERNCGHGVALRLGYRIAREHGARFILTLDADGQWGPDEIPDVLKPLLDEEADFVIGSRVLGRTETDDDIRQAGVHVFARLISFLTGVKVTDTSSGFRAMRAEVTATVRQEQVQYQTSELLIGAISQGYRVAEKPIVMHKRTAGESKKGNNLFYGVRYARVIFRTWWRERRAARG